MFTDQSLVVNIMSLLPTGLVHSFVSFCCIFALDFKINYVVLCACHTVLWVRPYATAPRWNLL